MKNLNPVTGDLEMFKHELGSILQSPEQKAALERVMNFIRAGATPEERELRLKIIQEHARKQVEQDIVGN